VTEEIEERYHLNTAISAIRILVNQIQSFPLAEGDRLQEEVLKKALETVVTLLYPFVPHICEELWERMGHRQPLLDHPWPTWDESLLVREEVQIAVQVNGRVRAQLRIPAGSTQERVVEAAVALERIRRYTEGRELRRVIYIQDRLLNLVVGE
jgi:leucyl-tRNA synthetase